MLYEVFKYDIVDDEIEATILYYESVSYELGVRFEAEIERTLDYLGARATYYLKLEDNLHRRIHIEGFPYAFIYSIEETRVIVKILFPQKQDPAKLWMRLASV